mgnify:CR=1 FL=1
MLQLRKRSDKPFFTPNAWWWSGFLVMWGEFGILELSRQRQVFGRKKYTTQLAIEWAIPGNQCQYRWFPNHVPEMCNLTLSQSKSTLQAWSYSNLPSNRLWIISCLGILRNDVSAAQHLRRCETLTKGTLVIPEWLSAFSFHPFCTLVLPGLLLSLRTP